MKNLLLLQQELQHWQQIIFDRPSDAAAYVRRGMAHFKLGQIAESIQDFDQAEQLDPRLTPYLWQRGLSYYYADRYEDGAQQFAIDLTVNAQDVEETVWRFLCQARSQDFTTAQRSLLVVRNDPRSVLRSVYELFAGNLTPEELLRTGKRLGDRGKFYSQLYAGLYFEAVGQVESAKVQINQAVQTFLEDDRSEDYMGYLAIVHQQLRHWN